MNIYEEHYILITKDFKDFLVEGEIVYGYLSKSNKYLYIQSSYELDYDDLEILDGYYPMENDFYKIPVKEICFDHMIPRKVDKELYIEYLRGKIDSQDFFGYRTPNNGVEFNGKLNLKISYLRDLLENSDDVNLVLDTYYDNNKCFIGFNEAFDAYAENKSDLEFKKEETTVIAFLSILDLYFEDNFKYDLDQIIESLNQESNYFDGKTNDRSYMLKVIFVEKHAQEGNYYLFKKYPHLLDIFKKYLDDLIKEDDMLALKAKAYLDYEGAFFWPINYSEAETLLLKLYNLKDYDAANTLGYLYFYHNPKGEPDYNKAFMYFSIGSAFDITESRYKLSDCLIQGLGTTKNEQLGFNLLTRLYVDIRDDFRNGNKLSKYADVALRMYDGYDKNIDNDPLEFCLRRKLHLITEAKYAIEMRKNTIDYIGDDLVYNKICDKYCLYEFKPLEDKIYLTDDLMLREILIDCLTLEENEKNNVKVDFKCTNKKDITIKIKFNKKLDTKMLVTFVDYGKSILTDELIIKGKTTVDFADSASFKDVFFFLREVKGNKYLFVGGAINCIVENPYVVLPKKLKKTGRLHKFVSVLYNDQHLSDRLPILYLADGFDLKENDRVLINRIYAFEEATVYKTFVLYESELDMKINEYERIIDKVESFSETKEIADFVA